MSQRRTAIVTGGGSGIGRATAHRLASGGITVAILDVNGEAAENVAKEITHQGDEAIAFGSVDVSDRAQVNAAVEQVHNTLGPVLVLVNNAGVTEFDRFLNISDDLWDRVMAVNLNGTFYCTQAVLPDMIAAKWGRIVNISSSSTYSGQPFMTHYVAAKSAVVGLTKALALEFGPKGVTVNTIPPGFVDTPMLRRAEKSGFLGGSVDEHAQRTPVRRSGRPEDIANACAFLVSDEAGYITGQIFGVNGGRNT
ncbi:3-oxoacyl-ACP reductase FabG [Yinghuangia sp. ASG 101]|uniref:SDR family NAD(P)-dependent oxidoreductase n=1 Tax=Yinghuangia sp. ASG 101 TaxID=2896848 RepID=UPI001E4FA061|nr:3-oxoacyl-ACP reductase FabG [Yinghuangia sp. ASG 101]UGQ12086.1 3-oxoacyl-ACP reductase FabG [Yinghuangia sp. ASG 101]